MAVRNIEQGYFDIDALPSFPVPITGLINTTELFKIKQEGNTVVCVIPQFNYTVNGTGVINANLPSQFSNPSNTNIMFIPVSLNIDGAPLVGQIMFVIGIAQLTFYADTNMGQLQSIIQ